MPGVRDLSDSFHERWLLTHPFAASTYGIPGYDDRVPDASESGEAARRSELESVRAETERLDPSALSEADAVTLGCLREYIADEMRGLDVRLVEHTVTAMPFSGPAVLLATAARTVLADERAADDYLERLRGGATWVDQQSERLRIGAGKGRLPVAPLVQQAIEWAERVLRADRSHRPRHRSASRRLGRGAGLARGAGRACRRRGQARARSVGRAAARAPAPCPLGRRAGPGPPPGWRRRLRPLRRVIHDAPAHPGGDPPNRPRGA